MGMEAGMGMEMGMGVEMGNGNGDGNGDGDEDMDEMGMGMGTFHQQAPRAQHTAAGFPPVCVCFCGYNSSAQGSRAHQQALSLADRMAARQ